MSVGQRCFTDFKNSSRAPSLVVLVRASDGDVLELLLEELLLFLESPNRGRLGLLPLRHNCCRGRSRYFRHNDNFADLYIVVVVVFKTWVEENVLTPEI